MTKMAWYVNHTYLVMLTAGKYMSLCELMDTNLGMVRYFIQNYAVDKSYIGGKIVY